MKLYQYSAGIDTSTVVRYNISLFFVWVVLSGLGYGVAYMPPIQVLLEWFPDRRGLASGAVISGFGCGALVFSPVATKLMSVFCVAPQFLSSSLATVTREGKLFAADGGGEVVFATAAELAKLPYQGLEEGFYLVGSGSTGAAAALVAIGAAYAPVIAACAAAIRRPPLGYAPPGFVAPPPSGSRLSATRNVHVDTVMRTPQFYLLFGTATLLGTGGMGLLAVAKPMVTEIFAGAMPSVVTPAFASAYLMSLAGGNLLGRLLWAAASDRIGRRNTFHIFALGGAGLFAAMPSLIEGATADAAPMLCLVRITIARN